LGAAAVFAFQISLIDVLAPQDAYGSHFLAFVLMEGAGGLVVLFLTLWQEGKRERRNKRADP